MKDKTLPDSLSREVREIYSPVWRAAAITLSLALVVLTLREGCGNRWSDAEIHAQEGRRRSLHQAIDRRCNVSDTDPQAAALDATLTSEFTRICGTAPNLRPLLAQCVPGTSHWLSCDGRVNAYRMYENEPVFVADTRATPDQHARRAPGFHDLGPIEDSRLEAAAIYAQRNARNDPEWRRHLQGLLTTQCGWEGSPVVTVEDVERFEGEAPESIYCEHLTMWGGAQYRFDVTAHTWARVPRR